MKVLLIKRLLDELLPDARQLNIEPLVLEEPFKSALNQWAKEV